MIYADTSILVPVLAREQSSDRVIDWMEKLDAGDIVASDWTDVEVASALSRKWRMEELDDKSFSVALGQWRALRDVSFGMFTVSGEDFRRASDLVSRTELGLRSGDALHLAIIVGHKLRLATFDIRMMDGARALGISLETI